MSETCWKQQKTKETPSIVTSQKHMYIVHLSDTKLLTFTTLLPE